MFNRPSFPASANRYRHANLTEDGSEKLDPTPLAVGVDLSYMTIEQQLARMVRYPDGDGGFYDDPAYDELLEEARENPPDLPFSKYEDRVADLNRHVAADIEARKAARAALEKNKKEVVDKPSDSAVISSGDSTDSET